MTYRTGTVCALVVAVIFGLGATSVRAQAALSSRTSIDVAGASPQDVFGTLAKTLECSLDIPADLQTPVTLNVSNVTVRTALSVLCETLGCSWSIEGRSLRIRTASTAVKLKAPVTQIPKKPSVLLEKLKRDTGSGRHFDNTPVRDVLVVLSKIAEMEITADEPLASKMITVDVSNRGIDAALKEILKQAEVTKAGYLTIYLRDGGAQVRLRIVSGMRKAPARKIKLGV